MTKENYPNTYRGGFDAGYELATAHMSAKFEAFKTHVSTLAGILRQGILENDGPDRIKLSNGKWLEGEGATLVIALIEKTADTLDLLVENS